MSVVAATPVPETVVEVLPDLYAKNSSGRDKIWSSRILKNEENHGIYEIQHGQHGGKLQLTRRVFTEGKNLGRSNATTPLEQCTNELKKKWADKQNKEGYMVRGTAAAADAPTALPAKQVIYPMLAQTYEPDKIKKNGIIFPCFVQPKLDGLRCLIYLNPDGNAECKIITQSRTGGHFDHLKHIKNSPFIYEILKGSPNKILDGELYTRDIPFENLAGLIKKKKVTAEDVKLMECIGYHIYDIIDLKNLTETFIERNSYLRMIEGILLPDGENKNIHPVHFVETYIIEDKTEFRDKFQQFIEEGYEGVMLRNIDGVYRQGVRSSDLQKYKEFQEEEYTIVDFTQGAGRDEGTIIWVCETPAGERFNVRPRGSVEYRRDLYENGAKYVGAKLTVIFQELSSFGVPRFPVGKCVRIDC